jgi:hypothetical protein
MFVDLFQYLQVPVTVRELTGIGKVFRTRRIFPRCESVIDGKYINMKVTEKRLGFLQL